MWETVHPRERARAPWRSPQTRARSRTSQIPKPQRITACTLLPFLRDQYMLESTCLLQRWRTPRRSLRRFSRNSCSTTTSPVRSSSTHTTSSLWSTSQNSQPEPKARSSWCTWSFSRWRWWGTVWWFISWCVNARCAPPPTSSSALWPSATCSSPSSASRSHCCRTSLLSGWEVRITLTRVKHWEPALTRYCILHLTLFRLMCYYTATVFITSHYSDLCVIIQLMSAY